MEWNRTTIRQGRWPRWTRRSVQALGGARQSGEEWKARCPAHDDHNPSLSIATAEDGSLLVHCHAGCSQEDVIAALEGRGLWPKSDRRGQRGRQDSIARPVPSI